MVKYHQKWSKTTKNGQKRSKTTKNQQKPAKKKHQNGQNTKNGQEPL